MSARRALRRVSLAGLVVVACLAAACSSSGQGAQGGGANSVTTNPHCTGKPLQFTSIVSLTGALSIPSISTETKNANTAALQAVNAECALGRPIAVDLCDDKSDPNQAQQCGLEARNNGSLALLGSSGLFDTGTTAARCPASSPPVARCSISPIRSPSRRPRGSRSSSAEAVSSPDWASTRTSSW